MENFKNIVVEEIQKRIISQIKEINFLDRWNTGKLVIPNHIIQQAWNNIKWEVVIETVTEFLQDKISQTITQNMIEETKTDVKKILGVEGMRDRLRMEAYPKIKEIIGL